MDVGEDAFGFMLVRFEGVCTGSADVNKSHQSGVCGGVNQLRVLATPDQASVVGVLDVMEELVKFTLLTRDVAPYLVDRYSERQESVEALASRWCSGFFELYE